MKYLKISYQIFVNIVIWMLECNNKYESELCLPIFSKILMFIYFSDKKNQMKPELLNDISRILTRKTIEVNFYEIALFSCSCSMFMICFFMPLIFIRISITIKLYSTLLKSTQNKKGQKIPGAQFSVSFFTAVSWEKDTKNCAPGIFFGSSYFETALVLLYKQWILMFYMMRFSFFLSVIWQNFSL